MPVLYLLVVFLEQYLHVAFSWNKIIDVAVSLHCKGILNLGLYCNKDTKFYI